MQHAMRFEGGFERNFPNLRREAVDYEGDDGVTYPIAAWPAGTDGLRFGFMEQRGKRFLAVRVLYGDREVLLRHPVALEPARHLGGKRFAPEPITLSDAPAGALLGDMLDANPRQRGEIVALRDQVRRALASRSQP
jgi:hypothetical protein